MTGAVIIRSEEGIRKVGVVRPGSASGAGKGLGAVGHWALGMRSASRGVRSASCDLRARPAKKLAPGGAAMKNVIVSFFAM